MGLQGEYCNTRVLGIPTISFQWKSTVKRTIFLTVWSLEVWRCDGFTNKQTKYSTRVRLYYTIILWWDQAENLGNHCLRLNYSCPRRDSEAQRYYYQIRRQWSWPPACKLPGCALGITVLFKYAAKAPAVWPRFQMPYLFGSMWGLWPFCNASVWWPRRIFLKMPSRMLRLPLLDLPHVFMKESVWIVHALHTLATASQALDIIHTVSWILSD